MKQYSEKKCRRERKRAGDREKEKVVKVDLSAFVLKRSLHLNNIKFIFQFTNFDLTVVNNSNLKYR